MSRTRLFAVALFALGTCAAIACTINPQPLPPSADQATDGSFREEGGSLGAVGDSGGSSSGSSGSGGNPGSDGSTGDDAANPPPPEGGTDAASDAPSDAPDDG
jgi:hypothetical protein